MTTLEALVSVSQTLLRANGRWCDNPKLMQDIRDTVHDAVKLFRDDESRLIGMAVAELEHRSSFIPKRDRN